eukprot:8970222-Prorocentrum_lima.AAC.2
MQREFQQQHQHTNGAQQPTVTPQGTPPQQRHNIADPPKTPTQPTEQGQQTGTGQQAQEIGRHDQDGDTSSNHQQ